MGFPGCEIQTLFYPNTVTRKIQEITFFIKNKTFTKQLESVKFSKVLKQKVKSVEMKRFEMISFFCYNALNWFYSLLKRFCIFMKRFYKFADKI